ncbi:MAG: hypothetical protein JWM35_1944 [Verrucomicrobia bacterium]|nr:hypothetical protein [Verrucomicrobiota bacterium]
MSLINDALKKAQHQRTGPATDQPPMPGTPQGFRAARITQQNQGTRKPILLLAGAGVAGVVVIAVAITIMVVRHEPAAPPLHPPARLVAAKSAANETSPTTSPVIVAPVITPAPKVEVPIATPVATQPAKAVAAESKAQPVATAPAPVPAPAPIQDAPRAAAPGSQDIRILTLLDSFRVTGIRSSGTESKVLMNDRVYRINDMVDYTLGIRLTKVATDSLTFVDANGTVYVKNF